MLAYFVITSHVIKNNKTMYTHMEPNQPIPIVVVVIIIIIVIVIIIINLIHIINITIPIVVIIVIQGHPSQGGNKAEIFIIVILGGKISFFAILGGRNFFAF